MQKDNRKTQTQQIPAIQEQDFRPILETSAQLLELLDEINLPATMEELNKSIFGFTHEIQEGVAQGDNCYFDVQVRLDRIETFANLMCFVAKAHDYISVLDRQVTHIENRKEFSNENQ